MFLKFISDSQIFAYRHHAAEKIDDNDADQLAAENPDDIMVEIADQIEIDAL